MAYFSNGSDGDWLDKLCEGCYLQDGCPVYFVQVDMNYEQIGNNNLEKTLSNLITLKEGCKVKNCLSKGIEAKIKVEVEKRVKQQLNLF